MRTVRLNIPTQIDKMLRAMAPNEEAFIVLLIKKELSKLSKKNEEKEMIAGYKYVAKEK